MSVHVDATGRRSVQVEFEVAGTPEDVWQAIATGPGVSSWFVPTDVEQQAGKPVAVTYHFGPGADIAGVVTTSEAPRLFILQGKGWTPDSPPIATEWHIEARSGGICVVRMVHSLFASTDAWDYEIEGACGGWAGFLSILKLYLKYFAGQPSAILQVTAPVATTEAETWDTLTTALGVNGVSIGQRWSTPAGVSPLGGVLELLTENPYDALLRLDAPAPGIVALGATTYPGGQGMAAMNIYFYGEQAGEFAARGKPVWEAFFQEHFPTPVESGSSS